MRTRRLCAQRIRSLQDFAPAGARVSSKLGKLGAQEDDKLAEVLGLDISRAATVSDCSHSQSRPSEAQFQNCFMTVLTSASRIFIPAFLNFL